MKAKINYNGKTIEIETISNPLNTWVVYKGKLYRNLNN